MNAIVATAVPSDEDGIMSLCRLLHKENGLFSLNEDSVRATIQTALRRDRSILGVVREGDAVVGCICLTIGRFWYSQDVFLSELFNFVHPDHRRSTYARDLIAFAKRASERLNMPLFIGVISNKRTAAKVKLYETVLGKQCGAFFIHNKDLIEHKDAA